MLLALLERVDPGPTFFRFRASEPGPRQPDLAYPLFNSKKERKQMCPHFKSPALVFAFVVLLLIPAETGAAAKKSDTPHVWRDIHITAKQFQFSPRQISIKNGETVRLSITSKDVLHGFRIVPLGIKVAVRPGETTEVFLTPVSPEKLVATCSEFCGKGHKKMELTINVEP